MDESSFVWKMLRVKDKYLVDSMSSVDYCLAEETYRKLSEKPSLDPNFTAKFLDLSKEKFKTEITMNIEKTLDEKGVGFFHNSQFAIGLDYVVNVKADENSALAGLDNFNGNWFRKENEASLNLGKTKELSFDVDFEAILEFVPLSEIEVVYEGDSFNILNLPYEEIIEEKGIVSDFNTIPYNFNWEDKKRLKELAIERLGRGLAKYEDRLFSEFHSLTEGEKYLRDDDLYKKMEKQERLDEPKVRERIALNAASSYVDHFKIGLLQKLRQEYHEDVSNLEKGLERIGNEQVFPRTIENSKLLLEEKKYTLDAVEQNKEAIFKEIQNGPFFYEG